MFVRWRIIGKGTSCSATLTIRTHCDMSSYFDKPIGFVIFLHFLDFFVCFLNFIIFHWRLLCIDVVCVLNSN